MDYRRPLFQLEQWSPFLAKKFWGLTSILESPFALTLGLKVRHLTDLSIEVEVPLTLFNKDEKGNLKPSILIGAGEFASKVLWQRHLDPQREELNLHSLHFKFLKPAVTNLKVRTELSEVERERSLRKMHGGESADYEMPIIFMDDQDRQVASINIIWNLKPLRPALLGAGKAP